jgi:hypothetical protein
MNMRTEAVPWHRSLTAEARVRTRVNVGFVVDKVALGQVFHLVIRFPPVKTIPPWLYILTYHLENEK